MLLHILRRLLKNESLTRILFNASLKEYTVSGKVVDIGGGKHQDYFTYFKDVTDIEIVTLDINTSDGDTQRVDFEKDTLPISENSIDTALLFNILEHIFNHQFLVNETYRIVKPGGNVLGFVPFLINYHPDPHDYFRYTCEALEKILQNAGFQQIEVKEIGAGPWYVNFNTIVLSIPKVVRVIIFPFYYLLDEVFVYLRPKLKKRYPLGYLFMAKK